MCLFDFIFWILVLKIKNNLKIYIMKTTIENVGRKNAMIITSEYKGFAKRIFISSCGIASVIWFKDGSIIYFNK